MNTYKRYKQSPTGYGRRDDEMRLKYTRGYSYTRNCNDSLYFLSPMKNPSQVVTKPFNSEFVMLFVMLLATSSASRAAG